MAVGCGDAAGDASIAGQEFALDTPLTTTLGAYIAASATRPATSVQG